MDKVWKLRQKINSDSLYKKKQASLILGKPKSYGDKFSKEILTTLGTKPQTKKEILDFIFKKYIQRRHIIDKKSIKTNLEYGLNYLKKQGKIKVISGKYHRVHKSYKRKKLLSKSKLRSVISSKNINTVKKNDIKNKHKVKFDILESNNFSDNF